MLLKLSDQVAYCHLRAEECERLATRTGMMRDYQSLARHWRQLAYSIQYPEQVTRFVRTTKGNGNARKPKEKA